MDDSETQRSPADVAPEEFWGARAAEYNEYIRRVVPRYEEQLDRLIDYLPHAAARVLELGCGTGNVSLRLAERYPAAQLTLVDGAPEMLELAAARLRARDVARPARVQLLAARFEELSFEADAFDLMVASLSLHHVDDVATVYPRLAPALTRGGSLVMLDGLRGATAAEHDVHMTRWGTYWQQMLSSEEITEVAQHVQQHDHYRTLTEHFALLTQAGFADLDCVWRDGLFAIVTARKR